MGITNAGFAEVAALIGEDTAASGSTFDAIAIGTDSTAFSADQTALISEDQRSAATGTRITTTQTNDTFQLAKTGFTFGSSKTIYEYGIFNHSTTGGTMLCRSVTSGQAVTSDDTLDVTIKVQIKQGS